MAGRQTNKAGRQAIKQKVIHIYTRTEMQTVKCVRKSVSGVVTRYKE